MDTSERINVYAPLPGGITGRLRDGDHTAEDLIGEVGRLADPDARRASAEQLRNSPELTKELPTEKLLPLLNDADVEVRNSGFLTVGSTRPSSDAV